MELAILLLIIIKLFFMSEELNAIKADLEASKLSTEKIAADVTGLHAKIDAVVGVPTAAEWAEVKALSGELVTSLAAVDAQTPDAVV